MDRPPHTSNPSQFFGIIFVYKGIENSVSLGEQRLYFLSFFVTELPQSRVLICQRKAPGEGIFEAVPGVYSTFSVILLCLRWAYLLKHCCRGFLLLARDGFRYFSTYLGREWSDMISVEWKNVLPRNKYFGKNWKNGAFVPPQQVFSFMEGVFVWIKLQALYPSKGSLEEKDMCVFETTSYQWCLLGL